MSGGGLVPWACGAFWTAAARADAAGHVGSRVDALITLDCVDTVFLTHVPTFPALSFAMHLHSAASSPLLKITISSA